MTDNSRTHNSASASGTMSRAANTGGEDIDRRASGMADEQNAYVASGSYDLEALALFLLGQVIVGRKQPADQALPESLETLMATARAFMLVGRSFESAMTYERLIRRYEQTAGAAEHVIWAYFNAACAFMRAGMTARACEHFTTVAQRRIEETAIDCRIVVLAVEGIRQSSILLDGMQTERNRRYSRHHK